MKPTDAKDSPQPNAATIAAMKDAEEGRLYDAASVEDFMRLLREDAAPEHLPLR